MNSQLHFPNSNNTAKTFLLVISFFMFLCGTFNAATRQTVANGDWNNASTWSGNSVPACGDSIIINSGNNVVISANVNFSCGNKTSLVVKGKITFGGGRKMYLPCNSRVYVYGGGSIVPGGGGNSNVLNICGSTHWRAGDGTYTGPACLPANLPECSMVMPVELSVFEGVMCGEFICLSWTTVTEKNNALFIVQKLQNDVFVNAGVISPQYPDGNSRKPLQYGFMDINAENGVNYYRLKQVDKDSSFSFSRIVVISKKSNDNVFVLWPNPSTGNFEIKTRGEASVVVRNSFGVTVLSFIHTGDQTTAVKGLPAGIYFCTLAGNGNTQTKTVVVR